MNLAVPHGKLKWLLEEPSPEDRAGFAIWAACHSGEDPSGLHWAAMGLLCHAWPMQVPRQLDAAGLAPALLQSWDAHQLSTVAPAEEARFELEYSSTA